MTEVHESTVEAYIDCNFPGESTLIIRLFIDLEPVILEAPAFDSKYVSLMVTGYDLYVNIPMSTRRGDFSEPSRILFYTERTPGYSGEAVEGVDKIAEMTGDFSSAVYRVMPHANEPERMQRILKAMNDYVIRMAPDAMPPATAFWSLTLYDNANGFFMPNDHKKYSVGGNAGMKLDADGGIAIHIAAEQPAGVPEENWLPLVRGDYGINVIMRIYAPDLERFATWTGPRLCENSAPDIIMLSSHGIVG